MRQVAKSLVANNYCDYCEIQASYAIGIAEPTSVFINTFESEKGNIDIGRIVAEKFDLTPSGIIKSLNLLNINYKKTSVYGHFGRENEGFTWEESIRF